MDILRKALKAAELEAITFKSVPFGALVPDLTPILCEAITNVDFNNEAHIDNIVATILNNYICYRICMSCDSWLDTLGEIQSTVESFLSSYSTELTFNAKMSLYLTASRTNFKLILKCVVFVANAAAFPFTCSSDVNLFITSDSVVAAFEIPPFVADVYPIPPAVCSIVGICSQDLRGWTMMNNMIAIHHERTAINSATSTLDLCTLVLHESKHVAIRAALKDFNVHSPDIGILSVDKQEKEAGRAAEIALWGFWPNFAQPVRPGKAEFLARTMLQNLRDSGKLMIPANLEPFVGDRRDQCSAIDMMVPVCWD